MFDELVPEPLKKTADAAAFSRFTRSLPIGYHLIHIGGAGSENHTGGTSLARPTTFEVFSVSFNAGSDTASSPPQIFDKTEASWAH